MGLFRKKKEVTRIRNPRSDGEDAGYAFRRSRTLTGSSSENIRAAGETRAQIKSPRLKEHELKRHRNILMLSLLGALVFLGATGWLIEQFSAGSLEIRSETPVTQTVDVARYQKILNNYYGSRPLERFRFVLREDTLLSYVQNEAPEVAAISVDGGGSIIGKNIATLRFREPLVGWQIRDQTYYIDSQGASFQISYFGSPAVTVHDASGIDPSAGVIASSRFLSFLGRVVHGVNSSGIGSVSKVTIPSGTTREVDITITQRPYRMKLQMDREPVGQVADIVSIVKYLDARGLAPEYVDVRVPSKAFYR